LLVVMMIIRPEGLIPTSRRRMELKKTAMDNPPPTPAEINETQEMVPK
jgi:hypothetical protein